jgi:hypothetical protein
MLGCWAIVAFDWACWHLKPVCCQGRPRARPDWRWSGLRCVSTLYMGYVIAADLLWQAPTRLISADARCE